MTILAATVLPLLVLNACAPVTKSLYSEISQKEYKDYTENVSQILVASNGSKVVVLGSEYHYIIDTPPGLVAVLDSPLHPKVRAQMDQFKVTPTADMTGSFTLVLPGSRLQLSSREAAQPCSISDARISSPVWRDGFRFLPALDPRVGHRLVL